MDGQISIFDFPEFLPKQEQSDFPCDGCKHDVNNSCSYNTNDDYCVLGDKREEKPKSIKTPCMRECDVEWCSIACFEKRGRIYDRVHREWFKNENGDVLIRETKECDWSPKSTICKHSGHSCNKEELWNVASSFDDIICNRTCCRQCEVSLCGARCNGSEEHRHPLLGIEECEHDHKSLCNRWGHNNRQIIEAKKDLPKGFSCAGCCWNCSEAPMHNGKCKFDCRIRRNNEN